MLRQTHIHRLFFLVLCLLFSFSLLTPIRLTSSDLGRHITNGRELLAGNTQVLFTNYYSYTMPDQRFVNHHWLFGVVSFLLEQIGGVELIHLTSILVLCLAFWAYLELIVYKADAKMAVIIGYPSLLFLITRTEVRPENFGLLFIIHVLWQLERTINKRSVTTSQVILLIIQQLIWVNLHISFVFGFSLPILLLCCNWLLNNPKMKDAQKQLLKLSVGLIVTSLFNPNFTLGLLEPFTILIDYGYSIVENQTLLFLYRQIGHQALIMYAFFQLVSLPILVLTIKKLSLYDTLLYLIGSILGYSALRHIPIFVFLSLPVVAKAASNLVHQVKKKTNLTYSNNAIWLVLGQFTFLFALVLITGNYLPSINLQSRHLGQLKNETQLVKFIREADLPTPIFNNYDIGSYLIYKLHPQVRVFVDNRPEAYNKSFMQEVYIAAQQNPEIWDRVVKELSIQSIVFGIQDITPWARSFVAHLETRNDWKKTYSDQAIAVWIRSTDPIDI